MISTSTREAIRARIDLVDLVGQYVPLRRAGQNFLARCPFHQEKSPSFNVSRDRGMFYCFGCKASGDLFTFYERVEGVSFIEALRALAEKANVTLEEEPRDPGRIAEEKRQREQLERLQHVCEVATAFFEQQLRDAPLSALAREAIENRGVGPEQTTAFRLGYAPAAWDGLTEHLRSRGVSPADAEMAGLLLASKSGRGHYDRFRHRLMFPVWDRHGHVVAFSGRVLPVTEDMAEGLVPEDAGKYINTPETPLFKKSEQLFGLQAAKAAMRTKAEAILVEGNFDVVSMHQHGFGHTVAPLGTSFTEAQARLLRRFAEKVTLVFDADEAGRKAARAAQGVCARAGILAHVATIPPSRAKDPDELLRSEGGAAFLQERIDGAPGIVEWLIDDAASRCGDNTHEQVAAVRALAPVIATVADSLERGAYVARLARALHLPEPELKKAVREAAEAAREEQQSNPFKQRRPERRDEPFRRPANDQGPPPARKEDSVSTATADALDAMLRCPALLVSETALELVPLLDSGFARLLLETAQAQWQGRGQLDGPALLALAPSDKARHWVSERMVASEEPDPQREELHRTALAQCVARLRFLRDGENVRRLKQELLRAQTDGDKDRVVELARQVKTIEQRMVAARQNRGVA